MVLFEDELKEIAKEIVRNEATDKVMIGLDYFDASINRLSAWVTGQRAMQKALLYALLMNHDELKKLQDEADFTALMVKGGGIQNASLRRGVERVLKAGEPFRRLSHRN